MALATPAAAACLRVGNTVTCSGASFTQFATPDTVNLTILPGALVSNVPASGVQLGNCPISPPVISVGRDSRVLNQGQLVGTGVCASGIFTGDGSSVQNDGFVATIDILGHGIDAGENSVVVHSGRITTDAQSAYGIFVGNGSRVTTEPGSAIETTGPGASAIVSGSGGSIDAGGSFTVRGALASGIDSGDNRINVRGTISALGIGGVGIKIAGPTAVVTNAGTIVGQRHAIEVTASGGASILNTAILRTESGFVDPGATIAINAPAGSATRIENRGSVVAPLGRPAIAGGQGSDTIDNFGIIEGDILLGGGSDVYMAASGSILRGRLDLGPDIDQVFLAGSGSLDAQVVGADILTKFSPGTWRLTQSVDASKGVAILGGSLAVDGQLTSEQVAVLPQGTLSGTGVIVASVQNSGTVEISNGAQLTINGSYAQDAGATLRVQLSSSGAAPLAVSGSVNVAGILDPGFGTRPLTGGESFALIDGTTRVSGQFDRVVGVTSHFLRASIVPAGRGLRLAIARLPYRTAANSLGAANVADALDGARARGTPALDSVFDFLENAPSATATAALDRLAPTLPTAIQTAVRLAGRSATAALGQWLEWGPSDGVPGSVRVWGQLSRRGGTDQGIRLVTEQAAAGLDYALADETRIGFSIIGQNNGVSSQLDSSRAATDMTAVALYASHAWPRWRVALSAMAGDGSPAWARPGLFGTNRATADLNFGQLLATATYAAAAGPFLVKPSVTFSADRTRIGPAIETGQAGLAIERRQHTSVRSGLGLRVVSTPGDWHPYLSTAISRDLNPAASLRAAFAADRQTAFDLTGPQPRRTEITIQAGVNVELGPGLMARLGYDGIVNEPLADRGTAMGLSYRW